MGIKSSRLVPDPTLASESKSKSGKITRPNISLWNVPNYCKQRIREAEKEGGREGSDSFCQIYNELKKYIDNTALDKKEGTLYLLFEPINIINNTLLNVESLLNSGEQFSDINKNLENIKNTFKSNPKMKFFFSFISFFLIYFILGSES